MTPPPVSDPTDRPLDATSGGKTGGGASEPAAPQKPYKSIQQAQVDQTKLWNLWFTRREFFTLSAWGVFFTFLAGSTMAALRFFIPAVTYEPSSTFKIGKPADFVPGEVNDKFKRSHRIWVVRDIPSGGGGIYVLWARCTHLGCTPNWMPVENKFKCPCHGSGFRKSGKNFEGPAPRPLERVALSLAEDGQILVDMNAHFKDPRDWKKPEAYLVVRG